MLSFASFIRVLFCILGLANIGIASILPQNYRLLPVADQSPVADPHLDRWLAAFTVKSKSGLQRDWQINPVTGAYDEYLAEFGNLTNEKSGSAIKDRVSALRQKMMAEKSPHPLLPYVHELWYRLKGSREVDLGPFYQDLKSGNSSLSCPGFRFLEGRLTDRNSLNRFSQKSVKWLEELRLSANHEGVARVLKVMHPMISPQSREVFAPALRHFVSGYEDALSGASWIGSDKKLNTDRSLANITSLARTKKCYSARSHLIRGIQTSGKERLKLSAALSAAGSVESCFRRKGFRSRLSLLQFLQPLFRESYGFRGEAVLAYRQARALWNADRFEAAGKILSDLELRSKEKKEARLLARVIYLQAQIAENQEQFSKAISLYEQYLSLFSEGESADLATRALIILHVGALQWDRVLAYSTEMVRKQQILAEDARHVSLMGFGLFWAGRAALELNRQDMAKELWQLVARDYFSTYYGALGHYMVERLSGKEFMLQPFFAEQFSPDVIYRPFIEEEKSRIARIQMLLRLGRGKDAACEASELKEIAGNPARTMVKSLFYHSTGDWLKAVQLFGGLPRSYRKSLSYGLERILFPVKYEKDVLHYGQKMGLDPGFIFSVIRQESVFNPRAYSVAGAQGLMQLMKQTARLEANKLKRSYVTAEKRKEIIKNVKVKSGLYDTETNIVLGSHYLKSLLNRYKNVPLALAAYNAGPTVVGRWRKYISADDPFYFIEMIPYRETRDYVKLILRNYFYYSRWYPSVDQKLEHLDNMTFSLLALGNKEDSPVTGDSGKFHGEAR